MDIDEKLALLARSWIADERLVAARRRADGNRNRKIIELAGELFHARYGEAPDPEWTGTYMEMLLACGGGHLTEADWREVLALDEELLVRSHAAASAARAVVDAFTGTPPDMPTWQWVGVPEDAFDMVFRKTIEREWTAEVAALVAASRELACGPSGPANE